MTVLFLHSGTDESRTAAEWLQTSGLPFSVVERLPERMDPRQTVIWLHAESQAVYRHMMPEAQQMIARHLRAGGRLLLTLQAALAVHDLGLEPRLPDIIAETTHTRPHDEHGMLGLLSFLRHPLFEPFHGGVYLHNPQPDDPLTQCGYAMPPGPEHGEAVAIHREYIGNDPTRVLMWEYPEPRVLCVGAHVHFDVGDAIYQSARETFLRHCLDYLTGPLPERRPVWPVPEIGVEVVPLKTRKKRPMKPLTMPQADLPRLSADAHRDRFFGLTGRRMVLMGRLGRGIDEVWAYPFMLLHHLTMTVNGRNLSEFAEGIEVGPERVRWQGRLDGQPFEVWLAVHPELPVGLLAVPDFPTDQELVIEFYSDLRIMWNYPMGVQGRLTVAHYRREARVQSQHAPHLAGFRVDATTVESQVDEASDEQQSRVKIRFVASPSGSGQPLVFLFAGAAGEDEQQALASWLSLSPQRILRDATKAAVQLQKSVTWLECPDAEAQAAVAWAVHRMNSFWARTPGLGEAYLAGFMTTRAGWNATRPGYAWYFGRDSVFTALAALYLGQFDRVAENLRFLARFQQFDGKIFHECTTSGIIHYDAADATPLFLWLLAKYVHWSGDRELLRELWPAAQKAMAFLFSTDRDGDGFIENTHVGHGWIEGGRYYGAHVTFYLAGLWIATLRAMAEMAAELAETDTSRDWYRRAMELIGRLNSEFWMDEDQHFALGKRQDGSLMRFVTLMPSVPIWLDVCEKDRGRKVVRRLLRRDMTTDWGARMVSEFDSGYRPTGYHDGSVWPLFTGWLCLAAFRVGQSRPALQALQQQWRIFQPISPGNMPEVLHGDVFKMAGVCPHQAWSEAMCLAPALEGLWGLDARFGRRMILQSKLPAHWTRARLRRVRIGQSVVEIDYRRTGRKLQWRLRLQGPAIELHFHPQLPFFAAMRRLRIDGQDRPSLPLVTELAPGETRIEIEVRGLFDVVPPENPLQPGQSNTGLALVETQTIGGNTVRLIFEGLAGHDYTFSTVHAGIEVQPVADLTMEREDGELRTWRLQLPPSDKKYARQAVDFVQV
ncbi:MAG: amylo-alpha-1,6-glucosidase [candidate division KSB1 bacterium]|nr:amylo-alpha-1,6-glucosidase [candidate division KSB1 bacterium]